MGATGGCCSLEQHLGHTWVNVFVIRIPPYSKQRARSSVAVAALLRHLRNDAPMSQIPNQQK